MQDKPCSEYNDNHTDGIRQQAITVHLAGQLQCLMIHSFVIQPKVCQSPWQI